MPQRKSRKLLADGLKFAEAPRWHDGKLWVSDMIGQRVVSIDLLGNAETVAEFDDEVSGLGFLPDGSLIVVVRARKQLVRIDGGHRSLYCDLGGIPCESLNDMVIDGSGRAYVDAVVRRKVPNADDIGESVVFVDENAEIRDVTTGLVFPNGLAVNPDRTQLVVAETWRYQITSFEIAPDGSLGDRRVFAQLGTAMTDGLCLDAQGAVWVASPSAAAYMRVGKDGSVLDVVETNGGWGVACVLGGDDRRTLFMLMADTTRESMHQPGGTHSRIEMMEVDVPGAGWP
jgi:sugar lactone lactonase YvrE